MNNLIKRIFRKILRECITLLTKQVKNRIILMKESNSGSNSYALWKYASIDAKKKYELILYQDIWDESLDFLGYIKKYRMLSSSKLIITTHGSYKPSKKHINFQLWHGCSTKKSGIMSFTKDNQGFKLVWKNVDYIMSYSQTYTTFLNAQMLSAPWKYVITGASRNDFLFNSDGLSNLIKIFGEDLRHKKIIFYLPTYRDCYGETLGNKSFDNIFGFDNFSTEQFDNYLDLNQIKIIYKPHPHEEDLVLSHFNNYPLNNLLILKNENLLFNQFDLYELINASDMLITDYSSIFYDYLLLDKPIIFTPVDLIDYSKSVGFLIESFEIWAPGPKVLDQNTLQIEIKKSLNDKSYYKEQRSWMTNHHHRYKDGESSMRLWRFIDKILKK